MKISFITFGCKVNQSETQKWEKLLKLRGYEIVNNPAEADVWIINTCAVTHKAEVQSRQAINKAKKLGKKALVTGCYVELAKLKDNENIKVLLNFEKDSLINHFRQINKSKDLNISRHRAIIKIQDGCDHFCSYCIVPFLKGKPRSYGTDEIINEILHYESLGIKEIVLSGINIGIYGKDLENISLKELIKLILQKTSIPKIRLSSIEINYIDDELLEVISDKRICKHLHIPLQNGSNRILSLMNRPYTVEEFIDKIERVLSFYPEIAIGTDIIVGFPSETEEDFKKTLQLIEKTNFSYIHVFTYSQRPFTKASEMPEQIPENLKKARATTLLEIAEKKRNDYIKRFVGKELEAIIENQKNNLFSATSDNYIKCLIKECNLSSGSLVKILITGTDGKYAFAKILK